MRSIRVRPFEPSEWPRYRDLRLEALREAPDAFGATLAHVSARPDASWRDRLREIDPTTDLPLVAEVGERFVGLAWGRVDASEPDTVRAYQMWVAPDARGRGAGRALLDAVVGWAENLGADRVALSVACGNAGAEALYRASGFAPCGDPVPMDGRPGLTEREMRLELPRAGPTTVPRREPRPDPRMDHDEAAERNRVAWTANAYRTWTLRHGTPERAAARIVADPRRTARRLLDFMGEPAGRTVAVPLASHGRVATALALLGADVTAFDASESNARYARELAAAAGVPLDYVVGDFQRTALGHLGRFDAVVMDLGIVHYFVDIDAFAASVRASARLGGTLVLSEFHPLVKKALDVGSGTPTLRGDYFEAGIESAPVPYDAFTGDASPACALRRWNLGEIVTAFAGAGFRVRRLAEHPSADCARLPGTFTLVATAE